MPQRGGGEKNLVGFNVITIVISIVALVISAISLFKSFQALKYNIESERARLEISPIEPPKIKTISTDNGFDVEFYLPITNVGKNPAKIISYETSGKFSIIDNPFDFKRKVIFPKNITITLKPGEKFYYSESCTAVSPDQIQKEQLIKKIDNGEANISVEVSLTYADLFSSRVYLLSAALAFNKKSTSFSKLK